MTLSDNIKTKIQAEYDSWKDKLWHKDRRAALLYVVQDAEMAEFLNTHLNEKVIDSISG